MATSTTVIERPQGFVCHEINTGWYDRAGEIVRRVLTDAEHPYDGLPIIVGWNFCVVLHMNEVERQVRDAEQRVKKNQYTKRDTALIGTYLRELRTHYQIIERCQANH